MYDRNPAALPRPARDWEEFVNLAEAEGRKHSDALIEAVHDWVKKKRRTHPSDE
jgi:hypothetical protein